MANSMADPGNTDTQAGSEVDASGAGAGGDQQHVVAGVSLFERQTGVDVLDGGSKGAKPVESGAAQGQPAKGADAPDAGSGQPDVAALQQQLQAATSQIQTLRGDLEAAVGKRQKAKGLAATTEITNAELLASVAKLEGDKRTTEAVDAVLDALHPGKRKLAKVVVRGLSVGPGAIDLAGEDHAAVVEAALKKIDKDFADLRKAPDSAVLPKLPGPAVGKNGVQAQRVGMHNQSGERVL